MGIIIRFIICGMSFQNIQSIICSFFSAGSQSHCRLLWTLNKKAFVSPSSATSFVSVFPSSSTLLTVYMKLNSSAHHSGKGAASSAVIMLDREGERSRVFVWTGDALLHNEWSALCGPDSFNMGLHASTYKLGGTSCQSRSKKSQQWQI